MILLLVERAPSEDLVRRAQSRIDLASLQEKRANFERSIGSRMCAPEPESGCFARGLRRRIRRLFGHVHNGGRPL